MTADLIRSLLFVPAIRPRFIEKAPSTGADVIVLDLEDSVPAAEKHEARERAAEALANIPDGDYQLFVRVNGLETGLTERELYSIVIDRLDGISLPKVNDAGDIRRVDAYLTLLEKARGLPPGQVKIIPWIESAMAIVNAAAICGASPRIVGAAIGGEDYTADMGLERTRDSAELDYVRKVVANASRAADVQPIDTPEPDFSDPDRLEQDCLRSRAIGYRGKFCIHPAQIETVNRVYAPTSAEIAWAKRVKAAYDQAEAEGIGAVALDGAMIDAPIIRRANRILDWSDKLEFLNQPGGRDAEG